MRRDLRSPASRAGRAARRTCRSRSSRSGSRRSPGRAPLRPSRRARSSSGSPHTRPRAPTTCRRRRTAGGGRGRRRGWGRGRGCRCARARSARARRSGVPRRLRDEAPADDRGGEQRVDAHRVVQRHDAERAVPVAEPVLDDLREPAGALRAVRARDALRASGRAGRVELDRRLASSEVERARVLVGGDELANLGRLADRRPPRRSRRCSTRGRRSRSRCESGTKTRAEPLAAPVELDRLGLVREDACDAVSGLDAARRESGGDARRALAQLGVGQALVVSPTSASASGVRSAA